MKFNFAVQEVFQGDQAFVGALDKACTAVINHRLDHCNIFSDVSLALDTDGSGGAGCLDLDAPPEAFLWLLLFRRSHSS